MRERERQVRERASKCQSAMMDSHERYALVVLATRLVSPPVFHEPDECANELHKLPSDGIGCIGRIDEAGVIAPLRSGATETLARS
jgi:hypothetical protein